MGYPEPMLIRPLPVALTAPRAAVSQPPVEDLPFGSATVYIPRGNESYQPIRKIPLDGYRRLSTEVRSESGQVRHNLIAPDRKTLSVVDTTGTPLFHYHSPDYVQQVQFDPRSQNSYVRTSHGIVVLDPKGQEVGSVMPESLNCLGNMTLLATGDVALAIPLGTFKDGNVMVLGPDLAPRWQSRTELAIDQVLDVGQGHIAVYDDGEGLQVRDAQGNLKCESDSLKLYSPLVHEGRLLFLESKPTKYKQEYANLVRYDSATGEVERFKVSAEADRIVPLPGGGFLLDEGPAAHPHITAYDADGKLMASFKFPDDTYPRGLHLSQDGKTVLMAADGDGHGGGGRLYRLDLGAPAQRNLLGKVKAQRPEPIYRNQGFVPGMLADGRIFVVHRQGVELLGVKSYANAGEFLQDIGPDTAMGSARYPLSSIAHQSTESTPCRLDAALDAAARSLKVSGGMMAAPPSPGSVFVTPDDCINFALPISPLPAAVFQAVGGSEEAMRRLLTAQVLDRPQLAETPFPGRPELKLRQTQEEITVESPGKSTRVFPPDNVGPHRLAIPVMMGGAPMVASATQDAKLVWHNPEKSSGSALVFDVGSPVSQLGLTSDGGSIAASTDAGGFVIFTPPGARSLQVPDQLAPEATATSAVVEGETTLRVGGVVIRKRRGAALAQARSSAAPP